MPTSYAQPQTLFIWAQDMFVHYVSGTKSLWSYRPSRGQGLLGVGPRWQSSKRSRHDAEGCLLV